MKAKITVEIKYKDEWCWICRYLNTNMDVTHGEGRTSDKAEYWCSLFLEPLNGPNRCEDCVKEAQATPGEF